MANPFPAKTFKRSLSLTALLLAGCSGAVVEDAASSSTGSSGAGGAPGSTSSATTAASSSASTSGSGGGSALAECKNDTDCSLYSDCCTCAALAPGEAPPGCGQPSCKQSQCTMVGATKAVCQYGTCTVAPAYTCDQKKVMCKALPPSCGPGTLPEVEGICWTGECVASWLCDVVPDCGACRADQLCVESFNDATFGPWWSCRAIPAACGGKASCACANAPVCAPGGFTSCTDIAGGIFCEL